MKKLIIAACALAFSATVLAKLPPAAPVDPKVAEAKAAQAKAAADANKVLQVKAEDRAVKNYQANMKKTGKPVPKPTPVVAPPAPAPAAVKTAAKDEKAKPKK